MAVNPVLTFCRLAPRHVRAQSILISVKNISMLATSVCRRPSQLGARSDYGVERYGFLAVRCGGCRNISTTCAALKDISLEDLEALMRGSDIQLIDVREPSEIKATGKIGKAVNIPLGQVKEALLLPDESFQDRYKAPKPQKHDHNIVFYGLGPIKSQAALQLARKAGYTHAREYSGGWEEYCAKKKA